MFWYDIFAHKWGGGGGSEKRCYLKKLERGEWQSKVEYFTVILSWF